MALRASLLAAVVSCVLLAAAPAGYAATCATKGTTTIIENDVARVYAYRIDGNPLYSRFGACAFEPGEDILFDKPISGILVYPPPAIALAETVVGYAADLCGEDSCETGVFALDLALIPGESIVRGASAAPPGRKKARVGSLVVRRVGTKPALAWIACPQRTDALGELGEQGTAKPNCVRAGDKDVVMRLESNQEKPVVVATGRDIDPRSLRLKGAKISWRQGHTTRRAALR